MDVACFRKPQLYPELGEVSFSSFSENWTGLRKTLGQGSLFSPTLFYGNK